MRRISLGLAALFLLGAAGAADEPKKSWSGLLYQEAVKALPGHVEKKLPNGAFTAGLVGDEKTFNKLVEVLGKAPGGKLDPVWAEWRKGIDWKTEAVAYVVLKANTNKLTFAAWDGDKKTATLAVRWSGIEPFYKDHFPAVFARVGRNVQFVEFRVDETKLGTVPLGGEEKKPEEKPAGGVRKLNVPLAGGLPGAGKTTTFASEAEAAKILGEAAAAILAKQANFETESVVLVAWQSSGPPFDTLEAKADADRKVVQFVQVPPTNPDGTPVRLRGRALKLGRDFYAIPRGWTVK